MAKITKIFQRDFSRAKKDNRFRGMEFVSKTEFVFINEDGDEFTIRADPEMEIGGIEIRVVRDNSADGLLLHPKVSNTITIT